MAVNDLASALDPTKKKPDPNDPNAAAGGDIYSNGALSPYGASAPQPIAGPMNNSAAGGPVTLGNGQNPSAISTLAPAAPAPAANDAALPAAPASNGAPPGVADPFAAMGGGTYVNGGWIPNNNPDAIARARAAGGGAATASAAPATAAPSPAGSPAAPGAPAPPPATVNDAFKQALMKGLSSTAPTLDSPELKGQSDAYHLATQRAGEQAREAMAERRAAGGGDFATQSGGFDQDLAGLYQHEGEANAQNDAGLVGQAASAQRDQLLKYAALAGNSLDADSARQLQEKLANLDAQVRREGVQSQAALGQGDLALRDKLGSGQLDLGLLTQLMGNDQFKQQLGANMGEFSATRDDNTWKTLMGLIG